MKFVSKATSLSLVTHSRVKKAILLASMIKYLEFGYLNIDISPYAVARIYLTPPYKKGYTVGVVWRVLDFCKLSHA